MDWFLYDNGVRHKRVNRPHFVSYSLQPLLPQFVLHIRKIDKSSATTFLIGTIPLLWEVHFSILHGYQFLVIQLFYFTNVARSPMLLDSANSRT